MGIWQDRNYRRSFEPNQIEELQNSGKQREDAERQLFVKAEGKTVHCLESWETVLLKSGVQNRNKIWMNLKI